jgi:hypothetical protein
MTVIAKLAVGVALAASAQSASAQPSDSPPHDWVNDARLVHLDATKAKTLAPLLAEVPPSSPEDFCAYGLVYGQLADLSSSARAHFLLGVCFDKGSATAFAQTHSDELDQSFRTVNKRLRNSTWSEVTLTSNLPNESIALSGWESMNLRSPSSIWLPAGSYRATFQGDKANLVSPLVRDFEVAKSNRGVVLIEHMLPTSVIAQPKDTKVDFSEEQPDSTAPTVIIDTKHKNLLPDRFGKREENTESSTAIADPLLHRARPANKPGDISASFGIMASTYYQSAAARRLGLGAAINLAKKTRPDISIESQVGFSFTAGTETMQRPVSIVLLGFGARKEWLVNGQSFHPFAGASVNFEARLGSQIFARVGAGGSVNVGAMFGQEQRFGLAMVASQGFTRLETGVASCIAVQVRVRIW